MTKLFRILYEHCKSPDILRTGPALFLTERNGSPRRIRPWTEEEAISVAKRYNLVSEKVFHEVQEVN